jgi:uncharacterized membrane protein YeaQ/YmgE (transglycosylase-associated protein family)
MTVTGIITAIVIGAIIGALGRFFAPGKRHISIPATIGVGIVAALLGTALANRVAPANAGGINWIELLLQVGLATLGVILITRRSGRRSR